MPAFGGPCSGRAVTGWLQATPSMDLDPNPIRKRGRPIGGGGEWLRRLRKIQRSSTFARMPMIMAGCVLGASAVSPLRR